VSLSVVLITQNEEANLGRTLESVLPLVGSGGAGEGTGEILIVDSGSIDRTVEIAKSFGARVFHEPWKGFAGQKNSAIEKASCDWILQLDADEALEPDLCRELQELLASSPDLAGFFIPRKNFFLGRWIRHGGFYPDPKLRLIRRGAGKFEEYGAHPTIKLNSGLKAGAVKHALLHNAYPTLRGYIDHMNSYSSMGAKVAVARGYRGFSVLDIVVRPWLTFLYNYGIRLGFLDGREGLLLHLYHSVYVSWKYAKAWEMARRQSDGTVR
jgi:glycosyltransferase involved in cell wall biosynthesis